MSFEEQITSKDKYPSIFLPQKEAIALIILQIVFANRRIKQTISWQISFIFLLGGMTTETLGDWAGGEE